MTARPIHLTQGTRWEYRAVTAGMPRPWQASLRQAVQGLSPRLMHAPWPRRWRAYGIPCERPPVVRGVDLRAQPLPPHGQLCALPATLDYAGACLEGIDVETDAKGAIDLCRLFGPPRDSRVAWLLTERISPRDEVLDLHLGADWWWQVLVDGVPLFDTFDHGNRTKPLDSAHRVPLRLAKGGHTFAIRVRSGNGGWSFAGAATRWVGHPGAPFTIEARRAFSVADPGRFAGLTFFGDEDTQVRLNGEAMPRPLEGMRYERLDAIPPGLLKPGRNELIRRWSEAESLAGAKVVALRGFRHSGSDRRLEVSGRLLGIPPEAVAIRTGPFIGPVGVDSIGLSCRTDATTAVELRLGGRCLRSPPGLIHRFCVDGLTPARRYRYAVRAVGAAKGRGGIAGTLPATGPVRLALYSDPSPQPQVLARVLAAMLTDRPQLALALGDFTGDGRSDANWDREFHALNPRWFAATPHLWVIGNHEEGSPLFPRLVITPGSEKLAVSALNWTTCVRHLRLIGIDGLEDWSAGSPHAKWLEAILAAAQEPFVVLLDHYPAWSSTDHGSNGADGRPWQRTVRESRDVLLPMLERHGATCFFNGHAHCYERSLPPGGVPCITSGGAGGFLYASQTGRGCNPHSQVMVPRHHWCRLTLQDQTLDLEAIALDDGSVIDRYRFIPRR